MLKFLLRASCAVSFFLGKAICAEDTIRLNGTEYNLSQGHNCFFMRSDNPTPLDADFLIIKDKEISAWGTTLEFLEESVDLHKLLMKNDDVSRWETPGDIKIEVGKKAFMRGAIYKAGKEILITAKDEIEATDVIWDAKTIILESPFIDLSKTLITTPETFTLKAPPLQGTSFVGSYLSSITFVPCGDWEKPFDCTFVGEIHFDPLNTRAKIAYYGVKEIRFNFIKHS